MSDNSSSTAAGVSFSSLLGLAFVILKLCNVINWSWWWVTCPFWAPLAVLVAVLVPLLITMYFNSKKENKERKARKSKWEERLEEIRMKRQEGI